MATIATLIERLGKPPRAVCLDWAWQISQMPSTNPNGIPQPNAMEYEPLKETIDHPRIWAQFKVDSTGILSPFDPGANFDTIRPQCVHQLLAWAAQSPLQTAMERDFNPIDRNTVFHAQPHPSVFNERASQESVYNDLASQPSMHELGTATSLDGMPHRPLTRPCKAGNHPKLGLWCGSIGLVCAAMAAIYWGITSPTSSSQASIKNSTDALAHSASKPPGPFNERQANFQSYQDTGSTEPITSQTSIRNPASAMEVNITNSNELELLQPDVMKDRSEAPIEQAVEPLIPELPLSTLTFKDQSEPPADINRAQPPVAQLAPTPPPQSLQDTDLVQVVSDMTVDSPTAVEELQMTPSTASSSEQPLLIPFRDKPQTIRMHERLSQRPNKAVWKLRLLTDEGFTVMPAETQSISERTPAIWRLTSSESRSPATAILVKLELVGKGSDLKCTIAGNAEDLPHLIMPIEADLLPNIQKRMGLVAADAEQFIESIKLSYASLPREQKTIASAQRKQLESQLRLARRLITIASELALMHDQLHGQITAVGQLSDGTADNAAVLFRFGSPDDNSQFDVPPSSQP